MIDDVLGFTLVAAILVVALWFWLRYVREGGL